MECRPERNKTTTEVRRTGWGTFIMPITVIFKDSLDVPIMLLLSHELKFEKGGETKTGSIWVKACIYNKLMGLK